MTTQDNNEAASVQSATDEIMHEVANNPDRVAVRSKVAAEVRKAVEAASASQSSTPVPRVGGNTSNESPGLAHVARQRQESPDCGACPGDGSVCAESCRLAAESPSAAVAEGVDTRNLHAILNVIAAHGQVTQSDVDRIETTYGAQQREAGRRERDAEIARLRTRVEDLIDIVCQKSGEVGRLRKAAREALARQPVSEEPIDFPQALAIATSVFDRYKEDHPKWWAKMDGTPILNDIAVRMAEAFRDEPDSAVPPAKAEGMSEEQRQAIRDAIGILSASTDRPIVAVLDSILAQQAKKGGADAAAGAACRGNTCKESVTSNSAKNGTESPETRMDTGPRSDVNSAAKVDVEAERAQAVQPSGAVAEYRPGSWFKARTLDEMQAFYLSRLPAIREAAKEHGYAIGAHGSQRRDFDLMAMQWRDGASDKDTLAHAIAVAACGVTHAGAHQWTKKPSGRFAVSLPICWTDHSNPDFKKPSVGHIDLSVIDLATPAPEQEAAQVVSTSQVHPDMALPSRQVKPKECDHGRNHTAHYDYIQCDDCQAINTDKGWGIASNQWFKSLDVARFYQQHGRLPEGIKS